jgi:hypothetical protein
VGSEARYAKPPIEDVVAEVPRIILPDTSIVLSADAQWVDAQPRTNECSADGGQSASIDGACDVNTLRNAVSNAADLSCYESSTKGFLTYAVVIDCEGRAIELLRLTDQTPLLSGDVRQAWLDSLANDRWPCYAGQSVQFTCIVSLFP